MKLKNFGLGLVALAALFIPRGSFADTNTTRLLLTKPTIGSANWGPKLNTDMDQIDVGVAVLSTANVFTAPQSITGVGSTQFTVGGSTLNVDTSLGSVGIGSAAPAAHTFHVRKDQNTSTVASLYNQSTGSSAFMTWYLFNGVHDGALSLYGPQATSTYLGVTLSSSTEVRSNATTGNLFVHAGTAGSVYIGASGVYVGSFTSTGSSLFGTNGSTSAAAGWVGEYFSSDTAAAQNAAGTGTFGNVVSLTFTAGDWDVSGTVNVLANGATVTRSVMGIGNISGSSGGGTSASSQIDIPIPLDGVRLAGGSLPPIRVLTATTTTFYLSSRLDYSVATPKVSGSIHARRVR